MYQNKDIMSIILKIAKFEHLSENVIVKLNQEKEIFIEVGWRMTINSYYRYIIIIAFLFNFMEILDCFLFIEGNQSSCFKINKYHFPIYYFMKLFE